MFADEFLVVLSLRKSNDYGQKWFRHCRLLDYDFDLSTYKMCYVTEQ